MDEYEKIGKPRPGLFRVERTSNHGDVEGPPPCEGARLFRVPVVDRRTVDDPRKLPIGKGSDGKWWYAEGENHRVEDGRIVRDKGWRLEWFIEIIDIVEFVRVYGDCVVGVGFDGHARIEIYDDYRE